MIRCRCASAQGRGFTLLEVLIAMVVIAVTAGVIAIFQRHSWASVRKTNNTLVAGQLIRRQVERMRMEIAVDTLTFWAPRNGEMTDSETGIRVSWVVSDARDPGNGVIDRVRQVDYTAAWTAGRAESLTVTTFLSKDF